MVRLAKHGVAFRVLYFRQKMLNCRGALDAGLLCLCVMRHAGVILRKCLVYTPEKKQDTLRRFRRVIRRGDVDTGVELNRFAVGISHLIHPSPPVL